MKTQEQNMEIVVEYKSTVLGPGVFWRGPAERVGEIHNIPARETARLVAKDGKPRVCGMWHVSAEPGMDIDTAQGGVRF